MEAILNFDLSVFEFVRANLWGPVMDTIMTVYTHLGEGGILWIVLGIIFLIPKKTRKGGIAILCSLIFMGIVNNEIIKPIIARPRPFLMFNPDWTTVDWPSAFSVNLLEKWEAIRDSLPDLAARWNTVTETTGYSFPTHLVDYPGSWSFPSGHTSSAFAVAMGLTMAVKNKVKVGVPIFLAAALMGFTRIYLHVHYCTDVLAGALAGVLYGFIGYLIANFLYNKFHDKIEAKIVELKNKKKAKS